MTIYYHLARSPQKSKTSTAFDKFEWLFVIPAKAGIHGSPIKAFGDDKFELPLEFIEQRTRRNRMC